MYSPLFSKNEIDNTSVSTYGSDRKHSDEDCEYPELQYKKPKKIFHTKQEQLNFVHSFLAKQKTEVTFIIIILVFLTECE